MERAEKIGLGVAGAGHVLLLAALSTHWLSADPLVLDNEPIEISIADEVALRSAAPKIADAPPPAASEPDNEPPSEPTPPAPRETLADPVPDIAPKTKPVAPPKNASSTPAKAKPSRGLRLDTSEWNTPSSGANPQVKPSAGVPASSIGPEQKSALGAEIRRQIKPFWKAPTGADADLLRTVVSVRLARDGSLVGDPQIVSTTGQTASNRGQVSLHQEQALKAVRLAAPFRLPPDLYDGWKSFTVNLDRKL